ncbi:uncharacterized protein FTOL_12101 [Fusarium torulosum]|uniref:LysM domain-containing protein n=1 Tax=Fusarium torulosum TaxID=33205 RepID=A0AAE8MJY5_9HYPO|nr:uncharacterized protein FTOL_12101 [Fusarium torulosum]
MLLPFQLGVNSLGGVFSIRSHGLFAGLVIASRLADAAGLAMFPQGSLADSGLSSNCEAILYQSINCPDEASALVATGYLNGDDPAVLKLVCRMTCGGSIGHQRSKVALICGSEEFFPGMSYVSLVDDFWSSWSQTCFTDTETGNNCNEVIAAFPKVDSLSKLPKYDLCSYCNVEQYAMMQADDYTGVYDEEVKASYEYVAQACNLDVDNFNATDSAFNFTVPDTGDDTYVSGNIYTTKSGDTCDSIALAQGVSAATMYYINSNIFDCSKIAPGTNLCLPLTCTNIYQVKKGDDCLDVALNNYILYDQLLSYNSQLNSDCTNLHDADPYWGSTLCVSTPGGTYSGQPLNTTEPSNPDPIDPPRNVPVANGTTLDCSHWFTHDGSLSCTQICLANKIPINLFTEANPSLNKTTCDKDLVVGNAYCLEPVAGWDDAVATGTSAPETSATSFATGTQSTAVSHSATHTSTSEKVPSPTQPGMVDSCNKWHYVDDGDGCYSIA